MNIKLWYFEITSKFDISYFFISKTTRLRNLVLSAKDRENFKKKNNEKSYFEKRLKVRYFQTTEDLFTGGALWK